MIRGYLVHDEVVGFQHQWPRGLLDAESCERLDALSPARQWEAADATRYQRLRSQMEKEWVPQMQRLLGIERSALPVIWDADFSTATKTRLGTTPTCCAKSTSAPSGLTRPRRREQWRQPRRAS
jgi:hypothetical protein